MQVLQYSENTALRCIVIEVLPPPPLDQPKRPMR